jgi:hypothetical protein
MDKNIFMDYCRILEVIQKDFPAFKVIGSKYKEETLDLWFDLLSEENITNFEFNSVFGRIIYHMFNCNCQIIPESGEVFDKSVKLMETSNNREDIVNAIITDIKYGTHEWYDEYAGSKTYIVYAFFYQHLKALRENRDIEYCPFV